MYQELHVSWVPIPEQPHDITIIFIFQIRKLRLSQIMEFSTISIAGIELNPFLVLKPMLYTLQWADACDMAMSNNCCCCLVSKLCLTYNLIDCSPPGPSVCGISQARILEWVDISFSRASSWGQTQLLLHWWVDSLPLSPKKAHVQKLLSSKHQTLTTGPQNRLSIRSVHTKLQDKSFLN